MAKITKNAKKSPSTRGASAKPLTDASGVESVPAVTEVAPAPPVEPEAQATPSVGAPPPAEVPAPSGARARTAAAARADATVYALTGELDPKRKGQVVKVAATLAVLGQATAAQVADKLMADGEYTCKPPAVIPVRTWLREFVAQGIARTI